MSNPLSLACRTAWPSVFALSLALSLPALPGVAQDTEAANTTPLAERETLPKGLSFRVLGQDVKGVTGIVVGQVVNVLVDEAGRPRAAVLDYGGFLGVGRRRIAVAWSVLRFSPEGIQLGLSRDNLRNFPDYKEGETVQMALPPLPVAAPAPSPAPPQEAPAAPPRPAPEKPPETPPETPAGTPLEAVPQSDLAAPSTPATDATPSATASPGAGAAPEPPPPATATPGKSE